MRLLMTVILIGALSACGGSDSGDGRPDDTLDPMVDTESPTDTSTEVLTNTTVTVSFTEAMDRTTLTPSTFTLTAGSAVPGDVSYDSNTFTAVFTPAVPLAADTLYTAEILPSVTDKAGNGLVAGLFWSFTTEGFIYRATVDSDGVEADGDNNGVTISASGRYVGFYSEATNLVAGDSNGMSDTFIHDLQTGATTIVSIGFDGAAANDASDDRPAINANGRLVAFYSAASNLADGDSNDDDDIFLRDVQSGTTTLVSVNSSGEQSNGYSSAMAMDADGRHVAFRCDATNLVVGDTNNEADIFVRDTIGGETTRVSVASDGSEANADSSSLAISPDGGHVAFTSSADNLVSGDDNAVADVFLRDIAAGTTTRVSIADGGAQADNRSSYPSVSADGRYVAFSSTATNLITDDTNGFEDIFVRDTHAGTTTRVSVSNAGAQANGPSASTELAISADGRFVTFGSYADNLVAEDDNGNDDIFVRDITAGTTIRVSVDADGNEGDGDVHSGMLSRDGRYVAFISDATNLVPDDTNEVGDIVRALNAAP